MYIMNHDTYTCDFCGIELAWDESDDVHGEMWGCEKCGKDFCYKCFVDAHGIKAWEDMTTNGLIGNYEIDVVLCPDCFKEVKNAL